MIPKDRDKKREREGGGEDEEDITLKSEQDEVNTAFLLVL